MLKYCMEILTKVSFDPHLFSKEIKKAYQWITVEEKAILKKWLRNKFGKDSKDIIESTIQDLDGKVEQKPLT